MDKENIKKHYGRTRGYRSAGPDIYALNIRFVYDEEPDSDSIPTGVVCKGPSGQDVDITFAVETYLKESTLEPKYRCELNYWKAKFRHALLQSGLSFETVEHLMLAAQKEKDGLNVYYSSYYL